MHRRDSGIGSTIDPATQREIEENLHPPLWRNPVPVARYGMVVIGAGPAGLAAAHAAASAGVTVALVERD
ncbi:MAG: NAD(P)-binding protein, partial [Pseudoxanthomonas sp.]